MSEFAKDDPTESAEKLIVYFDGSCPLCRSEIRFYRSQPGAEELRFLDVSERAGIICDGLTCSEAMARFHVQEPDGKLVSGAAAFVSVWERLPHWRWAAKMARLPGILSILEVAYRLFLPIRPVLSGVFGRLFRSP